MNTLLGKLWRYIPAEEETQILDRGIQQGFDFLAVEFPMEIWLRCKRSYRG